MKHRISLHRVIDESAARANEIKMFWRMSCRAAALCKGVLDDKAYAELDEVLDELDLIATMTDRQEMREKARKRVADLNAHVAREKERQRLAKEAVA